MDPAPYLWGILDTIGRFIAFALTTQMLLHHGFEMSNIVRVNQLMQLSIMLTRVALNLFLTMIGQGDFTVFDIPVPGTDAGNFMRKFQVLILILQGCIDLLNIKGALTD